MLVADSSGFLAATRPIRPSVQRLLLQLLVVIVTPSSRCVCPARSSAVVLRLARTVRTACLSSRFVVSLRLPHPGLSSTSPVSRYFFHSLTMVERFAFSLLATSLLATPSSHNVTACQHCFMLNLGLGAIFSDGKK